MQPISEAFPALDWEELDLALAARDQKAAQFEAQGLVCTCRTLYRITDGMPVYVVDAAKPEPEPDLRHVRREARPRRSSGKRHQPSTPRRDQTLEGKLKPKALGYEET